MPPEAHPNDAATLSAREDSGAVQVKEFYLDGKKRAVLNQNMTWPYKVSAQVL